MTETAVSKRNQETMLGQGYGRGIDSASSSDLVSKLRRILPFILEPHAVGLAYLYGSALTGTATPLSDVDVALVVDQDLSPLERLILLLRIQLDLVD